MLRKQLRKKLGRNEEPSTGIIGCYIFEYIRADDSRNKETPLYWVTSNKLYFTQLKEATFDRKTFVLEPFNEEQIYVLLRRFEILYSKELFESGEQ